MLIEHAVRNASSDFFFYLPDFIFRNPLQKIISFPSAAEQTNCAIHFTQEGNTLVSLGKSSFGGFILQGRVEQEDIKQLINSVISWSKDQTIMEIIIRSFPAIYSPEESNLTQEVLRNAGFLIKYKDVNQVVVVDALKDLPLNTHRRRRLRKSVERGFVFRKLTVDSLEAAYPLFVESRKNKGYSITMTQSELVEMFMKFPQHYLLFGVFDGEKMIAASISILVSRDILYCFYLGDSLSYRSVSPVTMLVDGIYHFCAAQNIRLLDLGTSGEKGIVTEGVYDFKKSLGCIDSHKLTFSRKI